MRYSKFLLGALLVPAGCGLVLLPSNKNQHSRTKFRTALQFSKNNCILKNTYTNPSRYQTKSSLFNSICDVDEEANKNVVVTAQNLREAKLTSASNEVIRLGDKMGNQGRSVVVFLRHLG